VCLALFYYVDLLERIRAATVDDESCSLLFVCGYTWEVFRDLFVIKVEVVGVLFVVVVLLLVSARVCWVLSSAYLICVVGRIIVVVVRRL
jgi:hypothetical protein